MSFISYLYQASSDIVTFRLNLENYACTYKTSQLYLSLYTRAKQL